MSAHRNFFQTSDFIICLFILLSVVLEYFIPTHLSISRFSSITIGVILLVISWIIIFTAKFQFKKFNQKSGPGNETTQLIKTGLFKYSRNPIYLGVLLICPALGFIFNSVYLMIAVIPVFILLKYLLITPEEKYLYQKFTGEYSDYCKKVRRWL